MATKKKTTAKKKKLTAKQIKYFGTARQKAALKAKRSKASKKTTKKTTKKKTTKSNKTLTTGQGVAIGVGSAALGAAGGALAATALQQQIQDLLNILNQSNIPVVSTVAGLLSNKNTGNTVPIPAASNGSLPSTTPLPATPTVPIVTADPRYAPLNPGTPGTLGTGSLAQGGDGFDPNTGEYIG